MSLSQALKAHYSNKNRPLNSRQIVLPGVATGIGATVTAANNPLLGTWIDVAAIADITTDTLVVGVLIDTPSAGCILSLDIGSTWAAGTNYDDATAVNAVPAAIVAAHRAWVRTEIATDAGIIMSIMLTFPVWIPNASGILARGYTVAGAETLNVSVICLQNFEGG